jgi:thiol-disulfide isomerase/thioredoxin
MKRVLLGLLLLTSGVAGAAEISAVEQEVATDVKSSNVTLVHLWAPWCPNCRAELASGGWKQFLGEHPDVKVIFVTVWRGEQDDGRALLERYGVGGQPNFRLRVHPNASRSRDTKTKEFLGLPVSWIPTTWVFRDGTLRFALNYGELRFAMLDQLVKDASDKWSH